MTKYIAHASIDERGKASGGSAGDQTGKEVCIRTWYNKPWSHVLRIKDEKIRKQFANNMIDLAKNNKIGYDQNQRNSLLTQASKVNFDFSKISTKCECDCSSAITVAILGAIYKLKGKNEYDKAYAILYAGSNCRTTSTLRSALTQLSMIDVFKSSTYVAGTSNAVFGDIYLKEGSHVVCYIDNGNKVSVSAQNNASANTSVNSVNYKVKVNTASGVNCRAEPNTNGAKITAYSNGTELTITKESGNWGYANNTGWVCLDYCQKVSTSTVSTSKATGTYEVTASALAVRTGPGTSYRRKTKPELTTDGQKHANSNGGLLKGTRVTVSKWSGNWAYIPSGWVSGDYLKKI